MGITDFLIRIGQKAGQIALAPFYEVGTNVGLSERNLKAFLEHKGIRDLLLYRSYEERGDVGIYTLSDGRKGFCLRVLPPPFIGEKFESQIQSFLEAVELPGTVVQFSTFSSQNIDKMIQNFIDSHPCEANVRHPDALKEIVKDRAEYIRKWTRESIVQNGADIRFRELINLVSIVLPAEYDDQTAREEFDRLRSALGGMHAVNFDAGSLVTLLREFLHNEKGPDDWNTFYDGRTALNSQLVGGGLKINTGDEDFKEGFVVNDTNYVTVLTTKEYPRSIDVSDFKDCFFDMTGQRIDVPVPGPFIATLTVVMDNIDEMRDKALQKLRHNLAELRKLPMKTIDGRPDLKERLDETRAQITEMTLNNEVPLRSMWSLILFERDKRKLRQSIASTKSRFSRLGWQIVPESFSNISLMEALYSLPMQYHEEIDELIARFYTLFKSNDASIVPLFSDSRGSSHTHMPLMGRTGQLQWFDPMDSDTNYNIAGTGASGSGKSFTLSDLAVLSIAKNGKGRIIDSLPSYKRTTELIGGDYVDFDDKSPVCLNFFTHILTKKDPETGEPVYEKGEDGQDFEIIMEEEIATIVPIIGMMCGVTVVSSGSDSAPDINTDTKTEYLATRFEQAIVASFRSRGRHAGMEDVYNYLKEVYQEERKEGNLSHAEHLHSVVTSIERFALPEGSYYSFFNGVNNLNTDLDFITYELTNLENKGVIYPIVMMSIANQIINEFFGDMNRFKFLLIDEFWKFKNMKIVMNFVVELARKVRKARGVLITITQSVMDYFTSPEAEAVFSNAAWKLILRQDASMLDTAIRQSKLSAGMAVAGLLKSVQKRDGYFGEFAILSERGPMISRHKVDPTSQWMYSTDPGQRERIEMVARKYNISEVDGAKFCAFQEEHPEIRDESEILFEIGVLERKEKEQIEEEKRKRKEFILNRLRTAIKQKSFAVFAQEIYDVDGKMVSREITSRVRDEGKSFIHPSEWLPIAKEAHLMKDVDTIVFKKAVEYYKAQEGFFSVNFAKASILDSSIVNEIIRVARKERVEGRLIVEIPLREFDSGDLDKVREKLILLRQAGIKISNDKMCLDISMRSVVSLPLDIIKINGGEAARLEGDEVQRLFTEMMIAFAKTNEYTVCFTDIPDKESYDAAVKLGGAYFEGDYLHAKERVI